MCNYFSPVRSIFILTFLFKHGIVHSIYLLYQSYINNSLVKKLVQLKQYSENYFNNTSMKAIYTWAYLCEALLMTLNKILVPSTGSESSKEKFTSEPGWSGKMKTKRKLWSKETINWEEENPVTVKNFVSQKWIMYYRKKCSVTGRYFLLH